MKKITILFVSILLASLQTFSQSPAWAWAKTAVGSGSAFTNINQSVATDGNGNVFVTGSFSDSYLDLGNNVTLTNTGGPDAYVIKYDASGNVLWARNAVGSGSEIGYGITTDPAGNVIVTGYFASPSITFGSVTIINTNTATQDIFIVKYDPYGNVLWAKSEGDVNNEGGFGVAADGNGNIYVTGIWSSPTITFGAYTLTISDTSQNIMDIFLVKYDASGNVVWAKGAGGTIGPSVPNDITCDNNGNVFITGYFNCPTITFGAYTIINYTATPTCGIDYDFYIAKYDASGNVLWAKGPDSNLGGSIQGNKLTTDYNGNVLVSGFFGGDTLVFGTTILTNPIGWNYEIFLVRYDPSGNVLWAKKEGGAYDDFPSGLAMDNNGNTFVTGYFNSSTITFGTTTLINNMGNASSDIFVVKYDVSGNVIWAISAGGQAWDISLDATIDINGSLLISGKFNNTPATFGSITLPVLTLGQHMFLAKLDNTTGVTAFLQQNTGINIYPNPVADVFTLNYPESGQEQFFEIKDLSGRLVLRTNLQVNTVHKNIDVSSLAKGVYIATVFNGNDFSSSQKLVVN